jgi:para-nitrobenzyl esterase
MRTVPLPADAVFHEPAPQKGFGAYHGAELWYTFDNLGTRNWPWELADQHLAGYMSDALVAVARSAHLPDWPDLARSGLARKLDTQLGVSVPLNRDGPMFFEHRALELASQP